VQVNEHTSSQINVLQPETVVNYTTLQLQVEIHMRVASDKDSTDELWQWYLLVGAQHLSIGGTGCQGSKHTVVTMVADKRTTSGHNISLQQR